jgi:hypothetical protein
MIGESVNFLCMLLNSAMFMGVFVWIIRSYIIPSVQYDFQSREHTVEMLAEEIANRAEEVAQVEKIYRDQEYEVARLTICFEQWTNVLAQRSALSEQEQGILLIRYKERCNENERARMKEKVRCLVAEQVLQKARLELQAYYMQPDKQIQYMNALCHYISHRASNE